MRFMRQHRESQLDLGGRQQWHYACLLTMYSKCWTRWRRRRFLQQILHTACRPTPTVHWPIVPHNPAQLICVKQQSRDKAMIRVRFSKARDVSVQELSLNINDVFPGQKRSPGHPPLGFVRQRVRTRWPVCTRWPPGSRCPPLDRRTSSPERALGQHKEGSRRTCPVYCPQRTRCWNQSRLFWCWSPHLIASSLPA